MQKFQKTGIATHFNNNQPTYDFATSSDLHESLNIIKQAQDMFDELPSQARKKFQNDPGQFLDFVQDKKNKDELHTRE